MCPGFADLLPAVERGWSPMRPIFDYELLDLSAIPEQQIARRSTPACGAAGLRSVLRPGVGVRLPEMRLLS